MAIGWQQILIVGLICLVLFSGKGRLSALLGDLGQGVRAFRLGLKEDDEQRAPANQKLSTKMPE